MCKSLARERRLLPGKRGKIRSQRERGTAHLCQTYMDNIVFRSFYLKNVRRYAIISINALPIDFHAPDSLGAQLEEENKGGVPMSLEAITSITEAEAQAKAAVAAAEGKAKQMLADAREAGKAALDAAAAKADNELAQLKLQTEKKAVEEAERLARQLEEQKTGLRELAGGKLEQAAALIVERIVNN